MDPVRMILENRRVTPVLGFLRRCLERVVELEFIERSIALASLTFTAMVPVGVVVSSTLPAVDRQSFSDSIVRRFDLDPQTAELVRAAFSAPDAVQSSISVLGILIIVGSALSFTRALQRVYERAWRLPSLGIRATPAGLVWLGGWIAFGAVFAGIRAAIVDTSRPVVSVIAALAFAGVLWLASPWILLSRRIAWRRLVPTALLTAVAMTVLSTASLVYMPRSIAESAASYGTIGVAISLVSWLVAAGFVLVGCAAVGAVIGERKEATS
jgi:membrane protein